MDGFFGITKYTPDECKKYEAKRRRRAYIANFAELLGGVCFFSLTLICTYVLFDGIVNYGKDYCAFLTKCWTSLFVPLISPEKPRLLIFLTAIAYCFGASILISIVIGAISSLFCKKGVDFVWDENGDSLEQYKEVLKKIQKGVVPGWSFLYMFFYILFFVIYTIISIVNDPEAKEMNILIAILVTVIVSVVLVIWGIVLYAIFFSVLQKIFKGKKLAVFERELEDYINWESASNAEKLEFEKKKQAEKLYQEAISKDPVDEKLMKEAFVLDSPKATVYLAKRSVLECADDDGVTESRRKTLYLNYGLIYALEYISPNEVKFLKCFCSAFAYDLDLDALYRTKARLVEIYNNGDLPEEYENVRIKLEDHIQKLIMEKPSQATKPEDGPTGKNPWDDVPDVDVDVSDM